MRSFARKISNKSWFSHPDASCAHSPKTAALQPGASHDSPGRDGGQSLPETPLQSVTPKYSKPTVALATPGSNQTQDDIAHDHSASPSEVHDPFLLRPYPKDETNSTISIKPSLEHPSHASSRAVSVSGCPASPLAGPAPGSGTGKHAINEGQPPWDRSFEVFWTRHSPATTGDNLNDEKAFRENLLRLRHTATPGFRPSTPAIRTQKQEHDSSPPKEAVEARVSQTGTLGERREPLNLPKANTCYFRLPDHIRLKIMKDTLAGRNADRKPIRMNHSLFLYEAWPVNRSRGAKIWPEDYFDSLQGVLSSLHNYTSVCSSMRADVMATLFLTRRFHVVYSPYVTSTLATAATHYMDRYGPLMTSITLEIDFTKVSGGPKPEAGGMDPGPGLQRLKQLVESFVCSQRARHETGPAIHDLRVLVRRYHGRRPQQPPPASPKPTTKHSSKKEGTPKSPTTTTATSTSPKPYYTPDTLVSNTLAPLKSLGSLVQSFTITGAPESFASDLVTSHCGSNNKQLAHHNRDQIVRHSTCRRFPAREYPLLPGQRAVVDFGPGSGPGLQGGGGKEGEGEGRVGLRVVVGREQGVVDGEGWEGVWDAGGLLLLNEEEVVEEEEEEQGRGDGGAGGDGDGNGVERGFWGNKGGRRAVRRVSDGVRCVFALGGKEKKEGQVAEKQMKADKGKG